MSAPIEVDRAELGIGVQPDWLQPDDRPPVDASGESGRTYGSVIVVAVLLGGGPAGSVSVARCDFLRIRLFRRAFHLTRPSWLPAPAWPTCWPD
jgi:hypothetical protein